MTKETIGKFLATNDANIVQMAKGVRDALTGKMTEKVAKQFKGMKLVKGEETSVLDVIQDIANNEDLKDGFLKKFDAIDKMHSGKKDAFRDLLKNATDDLGKTGTKNITESSHAGKLFMAEMQDRTEKLNKGMKDHKDNFKGLKTDEDKMKMLESLGYQPNGEHEFLKSLKGKTMTERDKLLNAEFKRLTKEGNFDLKATQDKFDKMFDSISSEKE
ncbi:hypothetical protein Zmor_022100 [Zophobas morio]|uniref:Uncharacterized protein n=1 Tax=Zophobas morio TaxID=2755281 RepID=A0AA38LZR2_9CUCU|nr:hypothetical protein Zmor_022100 [Zophobas morio]